MKVVMNDNGGINVEDISMEQIVLLVHALKESPHQDFMNDPELGKMFKLMAIMQSDVFDDLQSGKIDMSQFKLN